MAAVGMRVSVAAAMGIALLAQRCVCVHVFVAID